MTPQDRENISLAIALLKQALCRLRSLEQPTEEERKLLDKIIGSLQSPRRHLRGLLYPERLRIYHFQSLNPQDPAPTKPIENDPAAGRKLRL